MNSITGAVLAKFGSHISTDDMTSGKYITSHEPAEVAKICMRDIDPDFPRKMAPGGFLVAERNFGCGSSRETAAIAVKAAGTRVVIAEEFARIFYRNVIAAEAILAGNGIDAEKDVTALTMVDAASGLQDLVDGKTDAVISAISGSKMEELASKCNPYVIPVSNVEACSEASDGYYVPYDFQREFPGVTLGQSILGIVSMISVTKDTPAEAVYLYVKTCMESYEELAAVGSDLKDWTPEAAIRTAAGLPYHEGAVIYYKESGMWDDEIDAWQQERLSALGTES